MPLFSCLSAYFSLALCVSVPGLLFWETGEGVGTGTVRARKNRNAAEKEGEVESVSALTCSTCPYSLSLAPLPPSLFLSTVQDNYAINTLQSERG